MTLNRNTPLTNAERQARRKRSGPRPQMFVTVSRWVQARMNAVADYLGVPTSEAWETAGVQEASRFGGADTMTLTERGAALLGACASCGKALRSGDRVRRAGEFARHEGCPEKST